MACIHKANSKEAPCFSHVLNFITWVLGHVFTCIIDLDIQLSQSSSLHACRRLEDSSVILLYDPCKSVDSHWAHLVRYFGMYKPFNCMSCIIKYLRYLLTKHESGGATMVIHYGASLQFTIFVTPF